ncbi:MAG: rod shape-determining protein MreC [Rhodanobacteraceae bacterium]
MARNENAPLFTEGTASTLRLIGYLAITATLMVTDHRGHYLVSLRQYASSAIEPVYRLAALPADVARATRTAVVSQSELATENRQLRAALLLAQARLNRAAALARQNTRLKGLLDAQKNLGLSVQFARLIDIDLDPFRHRVVLDAGSNQSVSVGQPVIDAHGIMGQIVETLPNTSVAMLITDPNHAIPVVVERTGLRTIAYGSGAIDHLDLPNIPISADIKVGDSLVSSGLGGRFPAGFPVGTVREVKNNTSGLFAAAIVTPAAALDRSSDVLLLRDQAEPFGPPAPVEETGPPPDPANHVPVTAPPSGSSLP